MTSRPSEHAVVDRICAAFATLAFAVWMVMVANTDHAIPGVPILALLASPFALLALLGIGRVWIEEQGVKVMNKGRTFLLAWEDIDQFTLGRRGLLRRVGIAHMHDGRRVALWGIQGPNAATRRSDVASERLIGAMNAELQRRRSHDDSALERDDVSAEPDEQYAVAS